MPPNQAMNSGIVYLQVRATASITYINSRILIRTDRMGESAMNNLTLKANESTTNLRRILNENGEYQRAGSKASTDC
jgi:hypothetical protein